MLDFLFFVTVPLDFGLLISDRVFAATEEGDLGDLAGDLAVLALVGLVFEIVIFFVVNLVEDAALLASLKVPSCSFSEFFLFDSMVHVPSSFCFCGVFSISMLSSSILALSILYS